MNSYKDLLVSLTNTVKGITDDSRMVKKGYLFVAVKGFSHDGHDFIKEAQKKGAKVVVGEKDIKVKKNVTYLKVKDSRKALGEITSKWYGNPSEKLKVIGVTGTDGKTTTSYMISHLLNLSGKKTGLITTVSAKIGKKEIETGLHVTNPGVVELNKLLSLMVKKGCKFAVVEVTSHGIDQKRIAGIKFEMTVLTNITREHLDYHRTFENYKRVKMSFVNSTRKKVISKSTTSLKVFPGKFNNLNADTALSVVGKYGVTKTKALKLFSSFKLPTGRLEEIKNKKGIKIYVDFAHTPNALKSALKFIKGDTKKKVISVVGSAGERDKKKRSVMGEISGKYSDESVFTAEDPRSEDIHEILKDMSKKNKKATLIPERSEAIIYAINKAKKGDTVAVFGKAHERSMAYSDVEHPWSDHKMINYALYGKEDMVAIILAAGKGIRMKSSTQKVLMKLAGKPIVTYTMQNLRKSWFKNIVLVVNYKKEDVVKETHGLVKYVTQKEILGTGHAVAQAVKTISRKIKTVIVINGDDSAFYSTKTIKDVIKAHLREKRVITFVSLEKTNPHGLGRVVRSGSGRLVGIVEEKEATTKQRKIKEVNDGLYVFNRKWLVKNLPKIKKSKVGEYYLVDLVKIAIENNKKAGVYKLKNPEEWQGINSPEQLKIADTKMREILKEQVYGLEK